MAEPSTPDVVVCADIGSTFTKALLVNVVTGRVLATTDRPTWGDPDVARAVDLCRSDLAAVDARAAAAEVRACSSAGGGLWIAVVGNEELVTAEAGRRVALSSGGRVEYVVAVAGRDHADVVAEIRGWVTPGRDGGAPDVVLLTGGTDGGNRDALVDGARAVVDAGWTGPVVVAGNVDARDEVAKILDGLPSLVADNAVPRIGALAPDSARAAIRAVFLEHVIGGKRLSRRPDFVGMVRGATPDVVLTGVELLAHGLDEQHPGAGDVAVVDVGGATTDVYSVLTVDPERGESGLGRDVVARTAATRTVEADLGMRSSVHGVLAVAGDEVAARLRDAAERRAGDSSHVPATAEDLDVDEEIARIAAETAVRRHAGRSRVVVSPEGRVVERSGVDLREVGLLVGSGGVLRHGRAGVAERVLGGLVAAHHPEGWQLPERARVVVDQQYVLAAVGLLAVDHPRAAYLLARTLIDRPDRPVMA